MKWFVPSWNGDFRVEAIPGNDQQSVLKMHEPTLAEQGALRSLGELFVKRGWCQSQELWHSEGPKEQTVALTGPVGKVAAAMAKRLKAGKQTLSAVRYADGKVETVEGTEANLDRFIESAEEKSEKPEVGVTVKRPTPCCPQCFQGAIEPATEVLLSFLSPEQHEQWSRERALVCYGGRTGFRYLLAHRHTPLACRMGKICCDIDNGIVVHFHDHSVPPEEEVLAAMLCLQHREAWLRNEATMLSTVPGYYSLAQPLLGGNWKHQFKNPFGDGLDGVEDSALTNAFGEALMQFGRALCDAGKAKAQ